MTSMSANVFPQVAAVIALLGEAATAAVAAPLAGPDTHHACVRLCGQDGAAHGWCESDAAAGQGQGQGQGRAWFPMKASGAM